jgi:subtilisin family serine protease
LRGIAPDASLLDVNVFEPSHADRPSVATTFDVMHGIDWALSRHARILNMSFSGPRDALLERSVATANAKGVISVAAAGNGGPKAPFAYPAAYPEVIAVTATDVADRLFANANHGRYIDIAAPGVDVLAPSGDHAYQLVSGTSYAAAHVAGIVALMLERNPALSTSAMRETLAAAAIDLGPPGPDDQFGAGLVNAFASLQAAVSH